MQLTLNPIMNSDIHAFGLETVNKTTSTVDTYSLIFMGDVNNKEKKVTIYPLDFDSPSILKKTFNIFKSKRLAIAVRQNNIQYLKVHSDYNKILPTSEFHLQYKELTLPEAIGSNVKIIPMNDHEYKSYYEILQVWYQKAQKSTS